MSGAEQALGSETRDLIQSDRLSWIIHHPSVACRRIVSTRIGIRVIHIRTLKLVDWRTTVVEKTVAVGVDTNG